MRWISLLLIAAELTTARAFSSSPIIGRHDASIFPSCSQLRSSSLLASEDKEQVPITLLTGFLGSGKTCTLQHLLENKDGLKIGVIVNDLCSVNIDSKLVSGKAKNGIVELQNGCACCSLADELLTSVNALLEDDTRRELDAVVVELSGVADPMAIKFNWKTAISNGHPVTEKAALSQVVTLIDASTFGTDWMSFDRVGDRDNWADNDCAAHIEVPELLAEQVEAANVILINKKDLAGPDQVEIASSLAKSLNRDAAIEQVEYGRVSPSTIIRKRNDVVVPKDHSEGVEDIDNMSLAELNALLRDLQGDGGFIPEGSTLEEARDFVWDIVVNYESNSSEPEPKSATSVGQLGITSFVYRANRPFYTEKLLALLSQWPVPIKDNLDLNLLKEAQEGGYQVGGEHSNGESPFVGVLRSKGFCWLAPTRWSGIGEDSWRHNAAMYWSHAGRHFGISEAGKWWDSIPKEQMKEPMKENLDEFVTDKFRDKRQEVVFIGVSMDERKISEALDRCLISEDKGMSRYQEECKTYMLRG